MNWLYRLLDGWTKPSGSRFAMDVWARTHAGLGDLLSRSLQEAGAENQERAISHYERALQVFTPQFSPKDWAQTAYLLAITYQSRIQGNRAENLEQAINLYQQALEVRSRHSMPIEWAMTTVNLASVYYSRIFGERAKNLEQAIELLEQALQVLNRQALPYGWALATSNLAQAYLSRFRGKRAENLEKTIEFCKQSLLVRTRQTMPTDWAETTNILANAYYSRIQGERSENLEQAIDFHRQALQIYTREALPVEWAGVTNDLAVVYLYRLQGERSENLEQAIELLEQALQVMTRQSTPAAWALNIGNLASTYIARIKGEPAENLERAIDLYKQALQVCTQQTMPIEWAGATNNLAAVYLSRIRGDKAENLEQAIKLLQQALQVNTFEDMPIDWARIISNLANAYWQRIRGARAENIERAIEYNKQALKVYDNQTMTIEYANITMNLALCYRDRIRGGRAENIEQAIEYSNQVLKVRTYQAMPFAWAEAVAVLGTIYAYRLQGTPTENMKMAIEYIMQALSIYTLDWFPSQHLAFQHSLANAYIQQGCWLEAVEASAASLQAGENLYQTATTPEARQRELSRLQGIAAQYVYALYKTNPLSIADAQQAVFVLESNRARWLSESLALRTVKPIGVPMSLWQHFVALCTEIQALQVECRLPEDTPAKRSYLVLTELLRTAYTKLNETVKQIRGFAVDFMPQSDFVEIQAVMQENPLIYIITTTQGGLALIVDQSEIVEVWLNQLTEKELERQLISHNVNTDNNDGYLAAQLTNSALMYVILPDLVSWLGETIMSPIAIMLRQRLIGTQQEKAGKLSVTLIPCGRLSLLPLHSVNYFVDGKTTCFLDEFNVSFIPSARSLNHARNTLAQRQQQSPVLLGVGNPLPVSTEQGQSGWHSLPNAKIELEEIAEQLKQETVYAFYETSATRAAVLPHLSTATLLHLSCHGMFDPNDALGSGLQLADGMFTLRELLDTNSYQLNHLRLAVLSACQTAIADFNNLPDESIGLPAGFLQAGVPGVVGSLWPVEDRATALLMRRFYQNFLDKKLEPVAALGEAQCWLRDLTWAELGDYYRNFISRMSAGDALEVYNQSVRPKIQQEPNGRPYENPYYWAGFTFTGV